jgi:hypothetical protein
VRVGYARGYLLRWKEFPSLISYTGRVCDVSAFSNIYEVAKDVPIVTAATTYTAPNFSFSIILVVNQALSFPEMEYSAQSKPGLLCRIGCLG